MMQEAFGAYRAVVVDSPEAVQVAAWANVGEILKSFQTRSTPFAGSGEALVASGVNPTWGRALSVSLVVPRAGSDQPALVGVDHDLNSVFDA
jgi:hypothetical protein